MDPLLAALLGGGASLAAQFLLRPGRRFRFVPMGPPGPPGPAGPRGLNASELDSPEVDEDGEHLNLWDGLLQASRRDVNEVARQLNQRLASHEQCWMGTLASHCKDARTGQEAFQMAMADDWAEIRNGLEEWRKALVEDQRAWRTEVDATLAEMGGWRQELVDRLAVEGEELDATVRSGLEEFAAWKKDAIQVEAMQQQVASLTESLQQMQPWANEVAAWMENHGGGAIELMRRLQDLTEKVELMEAVVGSLPPRQPVTPMGPPPIGADGLGQEAAELLARSAEVRNVFMQRMAARGQRPPAAAAPIRPSL